MSHHLILKPINSQYSSSNERTAAGLSSHRLPNGFKLLAHQVETFKALRDPDTDIVINTAVTGDGKTLAALLLPGTIPNHSAMFMYPTNELLRDQHRGMQHIFKDKWPTSEKIRSIALDAPALDKLQTDMSLQRVSALERHFDYELLLTNPDIFHLMMQMRYQQVGSAPDLVLGSLASLYRLFVFDEFHLFGAPQIASALIGMLLLKAVSANRAKFLFLSATPQDLLSDWAAKAGLSVRVIEGRYTEHTSETRRILQQVELHLWDGNLEDWIGAHTDDVIIAFFNQHGAGAKGVIIGNSVATAHRIYKALREPLEREGISLGLNTGLTGQEERYASHDKDLIIGTSTIDVGVDFRINLLIFESVDAASHLQRLGRLGRHVDDGRGNAFERFEAHALLPSWVIARIAEQMPIHTLVERSAYHQQVEEAFPSTNSFRGYQKRWGYVQAGHVLATLNAPSIRSVYQQTNQQLLQRFEPIFGKAIIGRYIALRKEQPTLLEEAASFRGGNPFTALVINSSRESKEILPYNLLTLLRHGELEPMDLAKLLAENESERLTLERHKPLAAYRLFDWLPKPRRLYFSLDARIGDWPSDYFGRARVQGGFILHAENAPGMLDLNRKLARTDLVCALVVGLKPNELRRRLRLNWQISLVDFTSRDQAEGSAAFGRDALLLNTALNEASKRGAIDAAGRGSIII